MIIAVTGATGVVGRFVCDYFGAIGHTVRGLHRATSVLDGFAHAPVWFQGDMQDEQALTDLLAGADAVVHCAFSHAPGRYRGGEGDDPEDFWRTNLGGTLRLLRLVRQCRVQRAVLFSSRAVFGRRRPAEDPFSPVTDDYPLWPDSQYGALKASEEALVAATRDTIACALRPTGVYGVGFPVESSKWYGLVQNVLDGNVVKEVRTATEVHGGDVARAVECLLAAPEQAVRGRSFNCSDLTLSTRDLVEWVAAQADCDAVLPKTGQGVRNPMVCDSLRELGWIPGGQPLLEKTLEELIRAVRARG